MSETRVASETGHLAHHDFEGKAGAASYEVGLSEEINTIAEKFSLHPQRVLALRTEAQSAEAARGETHAREFMEQRMGSASVAFHPAHPAGRYSSQALFPRTFRN